MVEKTCRVCGMTGAEELFEKRQNRCKKCLSEYNKKLYENNKHEILKNKKEYREDNLEKFKEIDRKRYQENHEKERERRRKWRKYNPEKAKEIHRKFRQTSKGQISSHKSKSKRRNLGHSPINSWFKGSEAHHLRYSKTSEEQDNDITLYVPGKLHRSIPHNGVTGKGKRDINIACLEWYIANTPIEERNPKATKLYLNYCMLPEPEWNPTTCQEVSL
jgi:hypothetical protein